MTELSGTLAGLGLPAIVRFLSGLKKTGCLRLAQENWRGEVFFEVGLVSGASFDTRRGLSALDGLLQALPDASFSFESDVVGTVESGIAVSQEVLQAHLDELATRTNSKLPGLDAIPRAVAQNDARLNDEPVPLGRATLQTLVLADGRRTVREILIQRDSIEALWQICELIEAGLLEVRTDDGLDGPEIVQGPAAELLPAPLDNRCSKLGFEDDPTNAYARPTRLHRCFAAGAPLPLSLDQQRELCLSDQFGTCPRLAMAGVVPGLATDGEPGASRGGVDVDPEPDDPRILRLPFVGRRKVDQRDGRQGRHAVSGSAEPARLRSAASGGNLTPLRARMGGAKAGGLPPVPPTYGVQASTALADRRSLPEPRAAAGPGAEPTAPRPRLVAVPLEQPPGRLAWGGLAAGGGVLLAVVAVIAYLLMPHLGDLFTDDSVDTSALPNTRAIVAGTPIAQIAGAKLATPAARATVAAVPTAPITTGAAGSTIFDEDFSASTPHTWPNDPRGNARLTDKSYRLAPTQVGQFVAIPAPMTTGDPPQDVIVNATFRKLGGPAGGGYGIVLRDQGPASRDGSSQDGRYYVLEVGDRGEVGMWRRDGDHWVDLMPWQKSEAVKPGLAANELTARATGSRLSLSVNGKEVAVRTDATYASGPPGVFAGGDGNQVAVEHFSVQTP